MTARQLARWELAGVTGAVVAIDVIRAFTTAAYAFGAGARRIRLVSTVEEALAFKRSRLGAVAMGEERGLRPDGFDFPNSPAVVGAADLSGCVVVQRTSAGTPGLLAAHDADRVWAASLAVASATARAITRAGLGDPSYVLTGRFLDRPERPAADDRLTADTIETIRRGGAVDAAAVKAELMATDEAARTLRLGAVHCDPQDIELAGSIDVFAFAMEATLDTDGAWLDRVDG